ncbi:hypothetical protein [Halobacillus salinus]|uniref:hypothetical protein n=1 Tax=Halobacillus salinus TaxID=192814 RepID=UPI0009A673C6|nr:hypothetical protein [Halobacillus salinus]
MSWKKMLAIVVILIATLSPTTISADASPVKDHKYSHKVMRGMMHVMKKEEGLSKCEAKDRVDSLTQVEAMDYYLKKLEPHVDGRDVQFTVRAIYGISLQKASDLDAGKQVTGYPDYITEGVEASLKHKEVDVLELPKVKIMDLYLKSVDGDLPGAEVRVLINDIFGINLDGISRLEKAGISLWSKEQWIMHSDHDLFEVRTGRTDVDVYIVPTDYFTEQTGLTELPEDLQEKLKAIGYWYNEDIGAYYYAEPNGNSVPDPFKGQTLGTLAQFIQQEYADLLE